MVTSAPGKTTGAWPVYAISAGENYLGLASGNASVKGKLVDENGEPVNGALVEQSHFLSAKFLGNPSYMTKDDGLFYLKGVREGDAVIRVKHPDFPVQVVKRKSGSFTTVKLKSGATITGRVVDELGKPRVGMLVSAFPWNAYPESRDTFATTDKDPRAVPALIRAVPKTLQPASSDYGLIVKDPGLTQFMQKHQIGSRRGQHFSFGRPVREVHEALRVLTKHGPQHSPLNWMHRRKDLRAVASQQRQFHAEAEKWTKWWESNWEKFDVPGAYSKVNLPAPKFPDLSDYPSGLTITTKPEKDTGSSRDILSPVGAKDGGTYFIDLDVGHRYGWPKELPKGDVSSETIRKIDDWAAARGVDLMCHVIPTGEGNASYVLVGVNTKFWEIEPFDAKNIGSFLTKGELPKRRPVEGRMLLHHDPKGGAFLPARNSSFLYLTGDQALGIIKVTDFVREKQKMVGAVILPDQGVGRNRGVRFDYHGISR